MNPKTGQQTKADLDTLDFYLAKLRDNSGTTRGSRTSFQFMMSYAKRPGFWSETLREAGIVDGDEIIVLAAIPYPWAHDASFAALLIHQREESLAQDPKFRIFDCAVGMINERLNARDLSLY